MNIKMKKYFIGAVLLLSIFSAIAQKDTTLEFPFKNRSLYQSIQWIQSKTPVRFYYNNTLDSVQINWNQRSLSFTDALHLIEQQTGLFYSIVALNKIILTTKDIRTTAELENSYFENTKTIKEIDTSSPSIPITQNNQQLELAENKVWVIGDPNNPITASSIKLSGYVKDAKTGESLAGVSIISNDRKASAVSDATGFYRITLPKGNSTLYFSSTGMKSAKREIMAHNNGSFSVEIKEDVPTLKTVIVVAEKNSNVKRMQMGLEKLTAKNIKQIPVLLGEPDVLRALLTLPGVTSVGEASTGFNVRGGSSDQNLILLNDATIYNPSHVFGFFSAFNADQIKSAELYKSSIPERFGGRLSSVLDITTREGNTKKWSGSAGIGPLTSKFNIEGPLAKDKTTLLAGGRSSYSDFILKKIPDASYKNSSASFYDLNMNITHRFRNGDQLLLTGYVSKDAFRLSSDTTFRYQNKNWIVKWKHLFSKSLFMTVSGGMDHYDYDVTGDRGTVRAYQLRFGIDQQHARIEFNFTPHERHEINAGVSGIQYALQPGSFQPADANSKVTAQQVATEQAREMAAYIGDKFSLSDHLSLQAGFRFSNFQNLGAQKVYSYEEGLPRDISTVKDSTSYNKNDVIKTYQGPELRLGLRYAWNEHNSIKLGFNNIRQYIHLLSNTTAISPTDIWKLSDTHIQPQLGEQYAIGFYKDLPKAAIELSLELYYKSIRNYLDYKSGAQIILNQHIERDILNTKGTAYGAEWMVKKVNGKLNGWISYAYSRVLLEMDDPIAGQLINKGKPYPANFDKPHAVNVVGNYKFSHRYGLSMNMQYSTGRPITLPIAIFDLAGSQRVMYSERNQYRINDYFRADIAFNIEGNHKVKQKQHNSWSMGIYNITGRRNPYSVYFIEEGGKIKGYKLSVIGTAIPYITFNIKF